MHITLSRNPNDIINYTTFPNIMQMDTPPVKLLDQVRNKLRLKHYAYRTEEAYVHWIRRYIHFLYKQKQVLHIELSSIEALRARKDKRLPVVLSKPEVQPVLAHVPNPTFPLQAGLLYGAGLRLSECLRLRVKACPEHRRRNIDFGQPNIISSREIQKALKRA